MIGLKRKIAKHFEVYNLDEFRTSLLSNITETKCENLIFPDKKNRLRKLHPVLTYQMVNNRLGCINRDLNSVRNMKKIVDYWFIHRERPLKYRRGYDLEKNLMVVVPKSVSNQQITVSNQPVISSSSEVLSSQELLL